MNKTEGPGVPLPFLIHYALLAKWMGSAHELETMAHSFNFEKQLSNICQIAIK